ncbi:MAG: M1 family aminopeptidase [Planctomycetota bacterium]
MLHPTERRPVLLAVGLLACELAASPALAQDQGARPLACGKARALAQLYRAGRMPTGQAVGGVEAQATDDTDVLHCSLEVEVIPSQYDNLVGSNTMTIESRRNMLGDFVLRLRDQFTITSADVDGTPVAVSTISPSTRLVTLDHLYSDGDVFHLTIAYHGHAVSDGFGSIEFSSHNGNQIVYSLSEPYYAMTWWPIKDGDVAQAGDNSDKFTLEMAVIAPSQLVTAANGIKLGEDLLSGSRKRTRWASDYPIAPYLVCFSSTNYNTWSASYVALSGATMPVDFYIYPENDNAGNRAAWEACIDDIEIYRDLFGEYPFVAEKYGLYQCQFGGGMEHQTFTAIGGFWDWVIAHETGHQWWGDMITCKKWNDIWLNEGFASYCEALWAEFLPGSSGLPALKNYMNGKRYTGGGTVYVQDWELGSLWDIFDGNTSYNKGAWVLHMLRHVLGDDRFFSTLRAYRSAFEYRAATTEDFQSVCETSYGGSLGWFFQEWIYGEYTPAYQWGWTTRQVNGKTYLLVDIDQTQPGSYQRFTMPIDIRTDGDTHVVFNDADFEHFVLPLPAPPATVQFDPDAWILSSSVSNTSYVPGPPKIVEVSPPPGDRSRPGARVRPISVWFHTSVNAQAADFALVGERVGAVGFTMSPGSNVDVITLTPTEPLRPDRYTLTVKSTIKAVDSGMALDGEIEDPDAPASLPSGDGLPGGDAVIRFTITHAGNFPREQG